MKTDDNIKHCTHVNVNKNQGSLIKRRKHVDINKSKGLLIKLNIRTK